MEEAGLLAQETVEKVKIEKLPVTPDKYPEPAMAFGHLWQKVNEIIDVLNEGDE